MMSDILINLTEKIIRLPRFYRRWIILSLDLLICLLSIWFAFYLRLGFLVLPLDDSGWASKMLLTSIISVMLAIPIFIAAGLYRSILRHGGMNAMFLIGRACCFYSVIFFIVLVISKIEVPRSIGIIQPLLLLFLIGLSRSIIYIWIRIHNQVANRNSCMQRALIYGAGQTGRQFVAAMNNNSSMRIVGFIDDDVRLHGLTVDGLTIHNPCNMSELVSKNLITDILLAMPNIGRKRRSEILSWIVSITPIHVRTLPSVTELALGKITVSEINELDIYDLLGRDPIVSDSELTADCTFNKVVMITGAGGSIGSELCRQIASMNPKVLLMVEQSEFMLYNISEEIMEKFKIEAVPLLASIQDFDRISEIVMAWRPHTIYHTAAYKHVPLVEHNLIEGIRNNVMGTKNVATIAVANKVKNVVFISTDKAVRPTNVMGASKRVAELILQGLAAASISTNLSIVRFGNVLGSSGSVVPLFRRQIQNGGPVTVTHKDVTRYFMTIPEACQLVINAGSMAKGGEVFLLDMGEPVKIIDLAKKMIELSGYSVRDDVNLDGDILIQTIGLRPGEKLYEELLISGDLTVTDHPRIMMVREKFMPWIDLEKELNRLSVFLDLRDTLSVREIIESLVKDYQPAEKIVDWVYLENKGRNNSLTLKS